MSATLWILLAASYLIGSIPTAYWLGKLKGIDIREHGSGNVGATNALRVLGKKLGILCLVLDLIKGAVPVIAARMILDPADPATPWGIAGCGLGAILGHIFTIFLRFKGGKGVASTIGVFAALQFYPVLISAAVGVAIIWTTRYVALGSLVIALLIPTLTWAMSPAPPAADIALGVLLAAMIFWSHRGNIVRLATGKERKLGEKAGTVEEETGKPGPKKK